MSKLIPLRELTRRYPTAPEVDAIMDNLRSEKDMSVAIVASSIIDAALENLLRSKFKVKSANLMSEIFTDRGPLSGLYSKTLIAHAFGIVTPPLATELNAIRAIRNVFAHAKVPISFDHQSIAKVIHEQKLVSTLEKIMKPPRVKLDLSNKDWFLLAAQLVLIMLRTLEEHPGSADDAFREALEDDRAESTEAGKVEK